MVNPNTLIPKSPVLNVSRDLSLLVIRLILINTQAENTFYLKLMLQSNHKFLFIMCVLGKITKMKSITATKVL